MDPLSITASLVAMFTAVRDAAKTLSIITQDFRNAPVEILEVTTSIIRLERLLEVVEGALGTEGSSRIENPHTTQALAEFLQRTLRVLDGLHKICGDISNPKDRFAYRIKLQMKLPKRVEELRNSVDSLETLVAVLAIEPQMRAEPQVHSSQSTGQTQSETVAGHRFVYLITRDLGSSGSSLSSLHRDSTEMLAQIQMSQEDFEEMTTEGRQSLPTYKHWGVLVTFNDDIFKGTVFELYREGRLNTPARSPAADILRQSSQGVPLWTLRECWSRTYYDDDEIQTYSKASISYIGGTYDVHKRNCQVFLQHLVLHIRAPIEISEVFEGMNRGMNNLDLPMSEAPAVLKRRCREWKQWRRAHGPLVYRFGRQRTLDSFPNDVQARARIACSILAMTAVLWYNLSMHLCWGVNIGLLVWVATYAGLGSIFSPSNARKVMESFWKYEGSREDHLEHAIDDIIATDIEVLQRREVFIAKLDEIKALPLRWR